MKTQRILVLAVLLFALSLRSLYAQQSVYKKYEVGAGLGSGFYSGDIHQLPRLQNIKLGSELFFRYNVTPYFAGRVYLQTGNFGGSFENSTDESLDGIPYSFKSNYVGLGVIFEYNFFNFRGTRELHRMSPYVFAGFGIDNISVQAFKGNTSVTPQYLGYVPNIPFGIGVKYALNYRFNLALEARTIKPFSDAIDGLDSGSQNQNLYPALNPKNDLYYYLGASIAYRFITIRCPESSNDYF